MTDTENWQWKRLIFWHCVIALLVGSFVWGPTAGLWQKLDVAFFKFVNGSLHWSHSWQVFWALANHKLADWVEDIFVFGFYSVYIWKVQKGLKLKKTSELIFCTLLIAAVIYFINRKLFRHYHVHRESPTLVVDGSVRLSEYIPWLHIKEGSSKSFPGDHGTTALLFAASYFYVAGWRFGIFAALYAAFLCLPRLITGAHWLSDVIIGSGCITIFCLSWAFCSPMLRNCSNAIEKFLRFFSFRKMRQAEQKAD